jgi:DNA polymerase
MNIDKKMIPCDCQNTSCKEFATCCFVATEIVRVTGGEDDPIHLMFVGQGAGREEDFNMNPKNVLRQPFVGRAGAYLRNMIKFLWDSEIMVNVAISNSVRFHPLEAGGKKDRAPTDEELRDCLPLLDRDIGTVKPKTLISLGASTTKALAPETAEMSMGKILGNSYNYKGINVIPLYHPSFLTRNYGKFFANQRGDYHVRCVNVLKDCAQKNIANPL